MQSHNIGLVSAKIAGHELLEVAVVAFSGSNSVKYLFM